MSKLYAASGDMDEAFAWPKKAYEQHDALAGLVQSCSRVRSAALQLSFPAVPGTNEFSGIAE